MRRRSVGSEKSVERSQRFSSSTDIVAILALNSSRIARTVSIDLPSWLAKEIPGFAAALAWPQ